VETVNAQSTEQFEIGRHGAHTFGGLAARLETKLTAHTLSIALNWQLGKAAWLHIKPLAFPISHITLACHIGTFSIRTIVGTTGPSGRCLDNGGVRGGDREKRVQ